MTGSERRGDDGGLPGSLTLVRLFGVPVRVHWTVLIVMGLIAWAMGARELPSGYPGRPPWVYAVAGIAGAVAFLLCLLAHEVAHAVVARHHGVGTREITLWLFGGVAELQGEAPDAGAELRTAGVGPLVSLLLGGAFAALGTAVDAVGGSGPLLGLLSWLAAINILLAVFNGLPGAPLDGGRLLRAALWRWRGDRQWAALAAARAGRALGMVLIGVGLVELVLVRDVTALWLALIGWFVLGAAGQEVRQATVLATLAGVPVRAVMSPDPVTLPAGLTVAEFVQQHLPQHRHSSFPVVEDGRPLGLLGLSRVQELPVTKWVASTVGELATPIGEVPVAGPDDPIADLLPRLQAAPQQRGLVLDGGVLVGIVTLSDVARAIAQLTVRSRSAAGSAPAP